MKEISPSKKPERMYLKRIEILGFKTFAARTVLEFRPGITAIVGPNGSGKSNVADAIRWVLGEQSYLALRSKRAEDLIFGGGTRRAPSGFAEVSITIDNSDRLLPLPYSEVTIGRRATRAGEFEYHLNRNRVRLRDIQEAIGPLGGSYTIINQGLVDSALNLRPEERRRLFEDAAEIGTYEQRKADSERRLRETANNIQRCDDVLADLEPRLRSLKRQASIARSYRDLQAELQQLLVQSYTIQRQIARATLAATTLAEQTANQQLVDARARQASAASELHTLREGLRAIRERLQSLHATSSDLHDRAEAIQRDLAVGAERLIALERRAEDIDRQRQELVLRQSELERERAEAEQRLAAAEARLAEQRYVAHQHEQQLSQREAERRAARQALEQAQRAEIQANSALTEVRRRMQQVGQRREHLHQERNHLAPMLQQSTQTLAQRRYEAESATQALEQAQQIHTTNQTRLDLLRVDAEAIRAEQHHADEQIAQARRTLADSEARLESLTRLQQSYTGAFAGVKAAMQWAERQQRAGFTLVSSIIRTPANLETAIEVALGSRLQNIVVERWSDAEEAIEALKRSAAGRATFLPLDTIRSDMGRSGSEQKNSTLGRLGIAAELVDYDEHYRTVVWFLLGRTLVVTDMPTARAELRSLSGGWVIVTLAGEQINAGGALTGGANIRESGALRRERELRELPDLINKQRHAVQAAQQVRATLDQRATILEQSRREAEQQRRISQQQLDQQREALDRARRAAAQAEGDASIQSRRDTQIASELTDLEQQEQALHDEQVILIERETQAHQHFANLQKEEHTRSTSDHEQQQLLNALRAAVVAAEGELRTEAALLQSHRQNLARLATQHDEIDRRTNDLEYERSQLALHAQELEANHTALINAIDDLRRQIDPAETELADSEQTQITLEERTSTLTEQLLDHESAHSRTLIEAQRANDRLTTLWERAASDDIDLDTLPDIQRVIDQHGGAELQAGIDNPDLETHINSLRTRIQRMGVVNPLALEEYEETNQRYDFLSAQLTDLRAAERSLSELIAELDGAMQVRFERTFQAVAIEFERSFERLFGGGQARLILTKPDGEELNGAHNGAPLGVEIVARPPGKRQQTLALLSGGERALTAAALLFAILKVNPSPFCVLDEVDAALDEANVGRFREALLELARETQFLVITHNRGTIEAADTIYGVSMGDDSASRILSLRLEELVDAEA